MEREHQGREAQSGPELSVVVDIAGKTPEGWEPARGNDVCALAQA